MKSLAYKDWFGINHRVEVRINVTNACNLHCDFCDHDAHLPFNKNSAKVFRQAPLVATPEELEQFCTALLGIGEDDPHVLQGGEITVLPAKLIVRLIDVMHSFGRRVGMRTNGYSITNIPLESLNQLDFIYLNAHGNNHEAIEACSEYLAKNYSGRIINEENFFHRDISAFLKHGQGTVEQGLNCSHMMSTLTFIPPVIHPCCNSWALMNAVNTSDMKELLIKTGWSSENPNLKDTLANWRQSLPLPFLESFCADSCYLTAPETISPWVKIQTHRLDKVIKRG